MSKAVERGGSVDYALAVTQHVPFSPWKATGRRRFEVNGRTLGERLTKTVLAHTPKA